MTYISNPKIKPKLMTERRHDNMHVCCEFGLMLLLIGFPKLLEILMKEVGFKICWQEDHEKMHDLELSCSESSKVQT